MARAKLAGRTIAARLSAALRRQDWVAVALEFLIVAAGVMLGIQVANWNEERLERNAETRALAALHSELEAGNAIIADLVGRRLAWRDQLVEVSRTLHRDGPVPLNAQQCEAILSWKVYEIPPANLPTATELLASGRTGILRDEGVQRSLTNLRQSREAYDYLTQSISPAIERAHILEPAAFRMVPAMDARGEYEPLGSCDLSRIKDWDAFMTHLSDATDAMDAVYRRGMLPWTRSYSDLHGALDDALDLDHPK